MSVVMAMRERMFRAAAHNFGGGGSTPAGNTTVVQNSAPWTTQQPYLQQGYQGAQNLYQNYTPQYYPNSTVADMNNDQSGALNSIYNFGMAPSASATAANNFATDTLNGNYLSAGNPYFGGMVNQIAQSVQPQVDSQFEAAGRYGSGAAANAFASALTNQAGQLAFNNYTNEQNNQIKAMALQPSLDQQQLANYGAALNAGNAYQNQAQNQINAGVNQWNWQQQLPYQQLANFQSGIGGPVGLSGSTSTPYFTNPTATALGLGQLGLSAYNSGLFNNLGGLLGGGGGSSGGTWADELIGSGA